MRLRLSVLMLLQWAIPGSLIPLLSVYLEQSLHFGRIETALCCATQAVAAVASSQIAGQIADRWFPAEKAMSVYAALAGLLLFLLAELTSPLAVFFGTLAFWLVTGPMLLMGTTVCLCNLRDSPREFGPIRMWGTVGWLAISWAVAAWLGLSPGLFPERPAPLSDVFRVGGLIAFALAGYALTLPSTPPRPRVGAGRWLAPLQAARLLRGRPFLVYCVCLVGTSLTWPLSTQNAPLLLAQVGVPRAWLPAALTIAQASEIGLLCVYPGLLHRLGLRAMMSVGLLAWLMSLSIMAVGHTVALVVGSQLLNGFFVTGFMIAGQLYVDGLADDDLRASVQGLLAFATGLGLIAGNLLAGGLREATGGDLPPTFAVGAGITAVLVVLFLLGFRSPRRSGVPPEIRLEGDAERGARGMFDERDMTALLLAYIDGDTLARKALVDALEEAGDPRLEQFREEGIDWDQLAKRLGGQRGRSSSPYHSCLSGESARMRFRIDCARFGSPTTPEVTEAVRRARQAHAKKLFPELEL